MRSAGEYREFDCEERTPRIRPPEGKAKELDFEETYRRSMSQN